ncbi:MAG TPA: hypothetical protein VGG34_11815 [Opitutaceae bacterium]|jgi:hypothetical protein
MTTPATLWSLAIAAILSAAGSGLAAKFHLDREDKALGTARSAAKRYAAIRSNHERLLAEQPTAEEVRRLARARALAKALGARLLELKSQSETPEGRDADDSLSAKQWAYVGNATPREAITSVLWAASQGDVERLASLIGFSESGQAKAAGLYSQLPAASQQDYGSAEKVVATMIAGSFPKDASSVTITADREWGEDASVVMSVDHGPSGTRTNLYRFRLGPQGWRLLVPANVMDGISQSLLAQSEEALGAAD